MKHNEKKKQKKKKRICQKCRSACFFEHIITKQTRKLGFGEREKRREKHEKRNMKRADLKKKKKKKKKTEDPTQF